jgi:predicted RNA-binding Zn-ribbon protein involved in translation (DUF1610 family)
MPLVTSREPRGLVYDIENTHMVVATFSLFKPIIPPENIINESSIICISYKWVGEEDVHTISVADSPRKFKKNIHDDKAVVDKFLKVMRSADFYVAHNGDAFDAKIIGTRALTHGFPPLPKKPTVDTLKVARKVARFASNKLDYLGAVLGVGRKIHTSNELWLRVLRGDIDAVHEMERYNVQDVLLLDNVYQLIRPYMNNHPNMNLFTSDEINICPTCGSPNLKKEGVRHNVSRTAAKQTYSCKDCGSWCHSKLTKESVDVR